MRLARVALVLGTFSTAVAAQEVTLPLERYDQLRAQAGIAPSPPPPPAAAFALESAEMDVVVGETSATIDTRLTLTVLAERGAAIPLPRVGQLTGLQLGTLDGRIETGGERWVLHARTPGRHVVHLASVVHVSADEAAIRPVRGLAFPTPAAALVTGTLRAPAEVEEASFVEAIARRSGERTRDWTWVAMAGREVKVDLRGASLLPERDRLPLVFEARTTSWLEAGRTRQQVHATLAADVVQGRLPQLRVALPAGYEVISATAERLASWDVDGRVLVLTPETPVRGGWQVLVELAGDARAETEAPVLVPEGARRVRAAGLVSTIGPGEPVLLAPGSRRAADPEDRAALPPDVRGRSTVFALGDPAAPPRYAFKWSEETQVLGAQVHALTLDVLVGDGGRAAYQLWAEVASTGLGRLDVTFPAGFVADAASRDSREVLAAATPGAGTIAVPIAVREGRQVVHVRGLVPFAAVPAEGRFDVPLPAFSIPVARVAVRVVLPGGRVYRPAHATHASPPVPRPALERDRARLTALSREESASSAAAVLFPQPAGTSVVYASWSALTPTPEPLRIEVDREKRRASWF